MRRDSVLREQQERARAKVKTKSETHPSSIARAQAPPGKPEKGSEQREALQEPVRQLEQGKPEQTGTSSRPEIQGTEETPLETKPKCTPAKWPEPEAPGTRHVRRIKCRAIHRWQRVAVKWEAESIHQWEAEIVLRRRRDNRKAKKSRANTDRRAATAESRNFAKTHKR